LVLEDFSEVWALASYCTAEGVCGENSKNTEKEDEEDAEKAREVQDDFDDQEITGADDLLCSDWHGEDSILYQDHTVLGFFGLTTEYPESPNNTNEECGEQQHQCETQVIVSVKKLSKGSAKLKNEEVMSAWAATKSLLSANNSPSHGPNNAEVLALLFKTLQTMRHCTLFSG